MMNRLLLLGFILSMNLTSAQIKEQLVHEDRNRSWLTYLPNNYSESKSYPLLIALHGGGGTAKQLMKNTRSRFNQLADQENFIVVYPQGVKKSWNDNPNRDQNGFARKENIDDVGFINKMITQLETSYSINPDWIFACGISNGGLMSQTLAMELPEKIKAIGMVASNFGKHQIESKNSVQPFSIMFIHGTQDSVFPYKEGVIAVFNKSRGPVLGIEKSIAYMRFLNENDAGSNITALPNSSDDGCNSEHYVYSNHDNPSLKIELIKVYGGGHTWPGAKKQSLISKIVGATTQDFNACDKLWAFFKSLMN